MSKPKTPLELAGRMARKSAELFRGLRHPGMAYFGDIGAQAVGSAQAMAAEAAESDAAAIAIFDEMLADGATKLNTVRRLKRARAHVARSSALNRQLAAGGVR